MASFVTHMEFLLSFLIAELAMASCEERVIISMIFSFAALAKPLLEAVITARSNRHNKAVVATRYALRVFEGLLASS